jgi:hypothetical protein
VKPRALKKRKSLVPPLTVQNSFVDAIYLKHGRITTPLASEYLFKIYGSVNA